MRIRKNNIPRATRIKAELNQEIKKQEQLMADTLQKMTTMSALSKAWDELICIYNGCHTKIKELEKKMEFFVETGSKYGKQIEGDVKFFVNTYNIP